MLGNADTEEFLDRLYPLMDLIVPAFQRDGKRHVVVGIGCTGGRHRSVVLAEELASHLRGAGTVVKVEHRDRELQRE